MLIAVEKQDVQFV